SPGISSRHHCRANWLRVLASRHLPQLRPLWSRSLACVHYPGRLRTRTGTDNQSLWLTAFVARGTRQRSLCDRRRHRRLSDPASRSVAVSAASQWQLVSAARAAQSSLVSRSAVNPHTLQLLNGQRRNRSKRAAHEWSKTPEHSVAAQRSRGLSL